MEFTKVSYLYKCVLINVSPHLIQKRSFLFFGSNQLKLQQIIFIQSNLSLSFVYLLFMRVLYVLSFIQALLSIHESNSKLYNLKFKASQKVKLCFKHFL